MRKIACTHLLSTAGALSLALTALVGCAATLTTLDSRPIPARDPVMTHNSTSAAALTESPITLDDLRLLQQALLFGSDDVEALRMSHAVLKDQTSAILDVWYGFVGSTPQLLESFKNLETGEPDGAYLSAVRARFEQWILDTANAKYDQAWLDYQYEIGLRHHTAKKNATDGVKSVPIVHFRYLPALVYPVTATLKPFLEKGDHTPEEVERMHQAWIKSVLMQVILWSQPYVRDGEF